MVNAWSLAASILNGTFEKDYPIKKKKEVEHSDYYYDPNTKTTDLNSAALTKLSHMETLQNKYNISDYFETHYL